MGSKGINSQEKRVGGIMLAVSLAIGVAFAVVMLLFMGQNVQTAAEYVEDGAAQFAEEATFRISLESEGDDTLESSRLKAVLDDCCKGTDMEAACFVQGGTVLFASDGSAAQAGSNIFEVYPQMASLASQLQPDAEGEWHSWRGLDNLFTSDRQLCEARYCEGFGSYLLVTTSGGTVFSDMRERFTGLILTMGVVMVLLLLLVMSSVRWYRVRLVRVATTDELTGLANRKSFVTQYLRFVEQKKLGLGSLLLVDADYFKQINDNYGHAAGDRALVAIAEEVSELTRNGGFAGRWGGDEFIAVLKEPPAEVRGRVEEMIKRLAARDLGNGVRVSVSVGMTALDTSQKLERVVEKADAALYGTKEGGRGFLTVFDCAEDKPDKAHFAMAGAPVAAGIAGFDLAQPEKTAQIVGEGAAGDAEDTGDGSSRISSRKVVATAVARLGIAGVAERVQGGESQSARSDVAAQTGGLGDEKSSPGNGGMQAGRGSSPAVPAASSRDAAAPPRSKQHPLWELVLQSLLYAVGKMIPFVAGGGILIAIAFLVDAASVDVNMLPPETRANFGSITSLAAGMHQLGAAAFNFMLPIFAAFFARGLAGNHAFMAGFAGGYLASTGSSGFAGAIFAALVAAVVVKLMADFLEETGPLVRRVAPVLLYPIFSLVIMYLAMVFVIDPAATAFNSTLTSWLTALQDGNRVLLGGVCGAMMATDMGGPINKAAYHFGTAAIAAGSPDIMAAVMVGGMVPPCGIAICMLMFRDYFTEEQYNLTPSTFIMGLSFITEGALPFVLTDILRVIPSCMVGAGLAGALSIAYGCTLMAPHGGIFVFPVVGNAGWYLVALLAGSLLTALVLGALKRPARAPETVDEE